MLESMAPPWKKLQQNLQQNFQQNFQRFAENLVFNEAPRLIRQLQTSEGLQRGIQQGIKLGIDVGLSALGGVTVEPRPAIAAGRPVSRDSVPTAHRARRLVYAPDLDGRADPGEVVWTWVVYEEDPTRGKDRPVLVVGRDGATLLGLMLSSQERHSDEGNWVAIGSGNWDYEGRSSWVRLDRVLDVPEEGIRREGAILARETFDIVAVRLRSEYSWS
jgi:hypothetical protein